MKANIREKCVVLLSINFPKFFSKIFRKYYGGTPLNFPAVSDWSNEFILITFVFSYLSETQLCHMRWYEKVTKTVYIKEHGDVCEGGVTCNAGEEKTYLK